VAGPLGVTHCMVFSQTDKAVNLRLGRLPRGPSVVFRVHAYSLAGQVVASQKRPADVEEAYRHPPLVVMSGFTGATVAAAPVRAGLDAVPPSLAASEQAAEAAAASSHGMTDKAAFDRALQVTSTTLQHLFPSINAATVRLKECQRVVLFARDPQTGVIEMRHFVIRARPAGVSREVKKVLKPKHLPDLGGLEDVSQWLEGDAASGYATSDSEWEAEENEVHLPQALHGRGNRAAHQSVIKLSEVGPRLSLGLLRVETGVFGGEILFHSLVSKTAAEAEALKRVHVERDALKKMRRAEQEANVARKKTDLEEKRQAREERRRERLEDGGYEADPGSDGDEDENDGPDEEDDGLDEEDDGLDEEDDGLDEEDDGLDEEDDGPLEFDDDDEDEEEASPPSRPSKREREGTRVDGPSASRLKR
jgi:ribosome biogenesis protein SSF1/2